MIFASATLFHVLSCRGLVHDCETFLDLRLQLVWVLVVATRNRFAISLPPPRHHQSSPRHQDEKLTQCHTQDT